MKLVSLLKTPQIKFLYCLLILISSSLISCIRIGPPKIRQTVSGDTLGLSLYHGQVVQQTMKRPQWWFFNVMMQKPNEKYFKQAEYNGLRYQTEMLQDKLDKEYNDYVRDYYDEKMNVYEQKMFNALKVQNKFNKNQNKK